MNYKNWAVGAIFISVLTGCVTQNQIDRLGLGGYVQELQSIPWKEALVSHAFTNSSGQYEHNVKTNMSQFHSSEEEAAQESMTNDEVGMSTVWTNEMHGELTFIPGRREIKQRRHCRRYHIEYIFTGTYRTKEKQTGQACLNKGTARWEWINY